MRADAAETRDGLELASRAVAPCRCLCSRDDECFEFAARDAAVDDKERDMWCALFAFARVRRAREIESRRWRALKWRAWRV